MTGISESISVRPYQASDRVAVWSLSQIPFKGSTADPTVPLDLPARPDPGNFTDLVDVEASFLGVGGDFLVAELDDRVIAMGGFVPVSAAEAEILHVRVHPALRRQGVGRAIMAALEHRACDLGFGGLRLNTTVEQPEAIAFYRSLGYQESGREKFPKWELVWFQKTIRLDHRRHRQPK